jgi:hypothetical protein
VLNISLTPTLHLTDQPVYLQSQLWWNFVQVATPHVPNLPDHSTCYHSGWPKYATTMYSDFKTYIIWSYTCNPNIGQLAQVVHLDSVLTPTTDSIITYTYCHNITPLSLESNNTPNILGQSQL